MDATRSATPARAIRLGRARWSDLRLWGGVALMLTCVVGGAVLLGHEEETVTVWRASRDLSAGTVPSVVAGDVEAVQVGAEVARAGYAGLDLRAGEDGSGRLRWPVAAGELVPRSALAPARDVDVRLVTVPVDPGHAPVGLLPGDIVDAWATPRSDAGAIDRAEPALVLAAASVADVSADSLGIGGELAVVLRVPAEDAGRVVAAARTGVVDLVAVPITSQEVMP